MKTKQGSARPFAAFVLTATMVSVLVPGVAGANSGTTPALLRTLGGPSHAEMYPSGLEVAPNGDLVVANTGDNSVIRYAPNGTELWRIGTHGTGTGQFFNPRDVAVDSQGRVYVADTRNSRIVRLTASGQWDISFVGPSNDKMSWPMGLTITDDVLYVADAGKSKVRVMELNGTQIAAFTGPGACEFPDLRDVDADAAGNIYVANYKKSNIAKLSPTGQCLLTWGTNGSGNNQFKTPYGVRVADDPVTGQELVYVADGNNNQVKVFTTTGGFVGVMGTTGQPPAPGTFAELRRVAVTSDGDVWAADLWGWRIERFNRTATGWEYAQTIGAPLPAPTPTAVFHEAHQVAFAADGTAWIVDRVHHRLVQMNPATGAIIKTCGRRGSANGQFNWPQGVAVDPATGNLWVANTKQYNIHIVNPSTCNGIARFGTFGAGLTQLNWPYAIAIRTSDRVAFLPDNKNNRIVSYDVSTRAPIAAFGTQGTGANQFSEPGGIGLDPTNGHIYVADTLNDRIVELQSSNGSSFTWVRTIDAPGFNHPGGVAVDGGGRIAVADTLNHRVVLLNPNGSQLGVIDLPDMDDPESIAFGPDGKLYVSDTYHDRVLVYAALTGGGPDTTDPNGTVAVPTTDQVFTSVPATLSGAATDNVGVTAVRVAIQDRVSGRWLRRDNTWGTIQQHQAALASPGATSTAWTFAFTPAPGGSGRYTVRVTAVDGAGNVDPTKPSVNFEVNTSGGDTVPPNGTVGVPTNGQTLSGIPAQLSGGATDNVGVTDVRVAIRDRTTGLWLRPGGTWGAFFNHSATLGSPGGTSTAWTFSFTPAAGGSGNYALQVAAVDAAGNVDPTKPWVPFQLGP